MSWKYYKDTKNKIVKAMRVEPEVFEKKDNKGRRIGWDVRTEVLITRADNVLTKNQWKHPIRKNPAQYFDAHYSREDVLNYFVSNNTPNLSEINVEEYNTLRIQYNLEANKNNQRQN